MGSREHLSCAGLLVVVLALVVPHTAHVAVELGNKAAEGSHEALAAAPAGSPPAASTSHADTKPVAEPRFAEQRAPVDELVSSLVGSAAQAGTGKATVVNNDNSMSPGKKKPSSDMEKQQALARSRAELSSKKLGEQDKKLKRQHDDESRRDREKEKSETEYERDKARAQRLEHEQNQKTWAEDRYKTRSTMDTMRREDTLKHGIQTLQRSNTWEYRQAAQETDAKRASEENRKHQQEEASKAALESVKKTNIEATLKLRQEGENKRQESHNKKMAVAQQEAGAKAAQEQGRKQQLQEGQAKQQQHANEIASKQAQEASSKQEQNSKRVYRFYKRW